MRLVGRWADGQRWFGLLETLGSCQASWAACRTAIRRQRCQMKARRRGPDLEPLPDRTTSVVVARYPRATRS